MRKFLIFVACCLVSVLATYAQERYQTNNDNVSIYNISTTSSYSTPAFGKGCYVDVFEIDGDRAKIALNDDFVYVKTSDITKVSNSTRISPFEFSDKNWMNGFKISTPSLNFDFGDNHWMCYIILALSIALYVLRKRNDSSYLSDAQFLCYWLCMLFVSIFELAYMATGYEPAWFCDPDEVGWIMTIINFIVFALIVINQCQAFLDVMNEWRSETNSEISFVWGYYSWIGIVVVSIVLAFVAENLIPFAAIIFGICQIVQVVIIFKKVIEYDSVLSAIWFSLVYIVGSLATVIMLGLLISIIIIIVIALIILSILFAGKKK